MVRAAATGASLVARGPLTPPTGKHGNDGSPSMSPSATRAAGGDGDATEEEEEAAAADGNGDRLLLHMTVEIGDGRTGIVRVRRGDSAAALAHTFCLEHGLGQRALGLLTDHISSNVAQVLRQKGLEMEMAAAPASSAGVAAAARHASEAAGESSSPVPVVVGGTGTEGGGGGGGAEPAVATVESSCATESCAMEVGTRELRATQRDDVVMQSCCTTSSASCTTSASHTLHGGHASTVVSAAELVSGIGGGAIGGGACASHLDGGVARDGDGVGGGTRDAQASHALRDSRSAPTIATHSVAARSAADSAGAVACSSVPDARAKAWEGGLVRSSSDQALGATSTMDLCGFQSEYCTVRYGASTATTAGAATFLPGSMPAAAQSRAEGGVVYGSTDGPAAAAASGVAASGSYSAREHPMHFSFQHHGSSTSAPPSARTGRASERGLERAPLSASARSKSVGRDAAGRGGGASQIAAAASTTATSARAVTTARRAKSAPRGSTTSSRVSSLAAAGFGSASGLEMIHAPSTASAHARDSVPYVSEHSKRLAERRRVSGHVHERLFTEASHLGTHKKVGRPAFAAASVRHAQPRPADSPRPVAAPPLPLPCHRLWRSMPSRSR